MKNITLYDKLTGALIGLSRAMIENNSPDDKAYKALAEGLRIMNPDDETTIEAMIEKLHAEKHRLAPNCSECASPCGRTADYDMEQFYNADDIVVKLRSAILLWLREIAVFDEFGKLNTYTSQEAYKFICSSLFELGYIDDEESLMKLSEKVNEFIIKCIKK